VDLRVRRTEGSFVIDARGRKYIDFVAGWCVGNFGWGNRQLEQAIRHSKAPDYVYPQYGYRRWDELTELLAEITPGNLRKTFRATGGSEAVDIALQIARAYTGRRKFLSIEDAYHGNTIGTVELGERIAPPLDAKAADKIETRLKRRNVAAFLMEPIICNLGVLVPDADFMRRLSAMCKKYGTLLIMDEVACGFGRTGRLFASEYFDIEPDILCMAKAITGGYAPMGATITTARIAKAVEGEVEFWSTYGWHPLSVEAAIANIRWIMKNKRALLDHVNAMGELFRDRLTRVEFRKTPKLSIKGLAIGIDLRDSDYAERIQAKCQREGLLIETQDAALTLFPPLNIGESIANKGLDILERCAA
jgi:4-aminobutyrate aminotransferase-like enzyme